MSRQKYVFVVMLWPLIGSQKQAHSFSTQMLPSSSSLLSSPWPIPCGHRNDTWWITSKVPSLRFCFCLWSACKIFRIQLYRMFFELIFRNFCVVVIRIHQKFIWSRRNSNPRVSIVSAQRPDSNFDSMFTMQATGRDFQHVSNFCVSLDPSSWLWWSIFSWNSVFTTSHCTKLSEITLAFDRLAKSKYIR